MDMATREDRLFGLWFGLLGPPIIWAARFGASYVLVPLACARGTVFPLQLLTVVALGGTAWAGVVAGKHWRAARDTRQTDPSGARARTRFMGLAGLLGSALFFGAIVVEGLALFFVDPCQTGGSPL